MKKIISFLLVIVSLISCFALTITASPSATHKSDEGRLPFEDVRDNHWFAEAVKFCYANGIINGMNEYTFGFAGQLTRAQFVMMLANLEGVDTGEYTVTKFTDVKSTHWYYGAVAWAYENDIVNGMTETTFVPNGQLTRAQLATIMYNYMKDKYTVEVSDELLDKYTDKPKETYWFYDSIKYAVSASLISGVTETTIVPTGIVTRAQAAVIFKSFMEKYYYGSCEHSFSEADCTNPATCSECGLKNGLPKGHRIVAYNCTVTDVCLDCGAEVAPSNIMHAFDAATCTKPRTCRDCGVTRGEAKGHTWNAATCTTPKTCTVCKATEGAAKGHNWKAATCTTAKTCVVCNATEGKALGHTTTTGTCSRCGKVFTVSDYDKIVNLLKAKGQYDSNSGSYELMIEDSDSQTILAYYVLEECIDITNFRSYGNGVIDATEIVIFKNTNVYEYLYAYAFTDEPFFGYGKIDAATFTKSTKEGFSEYEGTLKSTYTDYMNSALKEMLNDVDKILKPYGYSVKQLGFKAY